MSPANLREPPGQCNCSVNKIAWAILSSSCYHQPLQNNLCKSPVKVLSLEWDFYHVLTQCYLMSCFLFPSVAVLSSFEPMCCVLGSGIRFSILYASGQMFKPTYSQRHAHGFFPGACMSRIIKHEQLWPAALPSYIMDTKKSRNWNLANGCIPGIWMKKLNLSSLLRYLNKTVL